MFVPGSSKLRLATKGIHFLACEVEGLWQERLLKPLSRKAWGRRLHSFSAWLEAEGLDSLWQIHRKWALSLHTIAEGDESNCKLKCSSFNISGMPGLGETTQSKSMPFPWKILPAIWRPFTVLLDFIL